MAKYMPLAYFYAWLPELRNSMFWFESLVEGGGGSVQVFELKFKESIGVGENTIRNGT